MPSDAQSGAGTSQDDWNPRDHAPLGPCVVCGDKVYPMDETQVGRGRPCMHKGCGL